MTALNHWGIAPLCLIIEQSNKKEPNDTAPVRLGQVSQWQLSMT
jgi:hypothetical protein